MSAVAENPLVMQFDQQSQRGVLIVNMSPIPLEVTRPFKAGLNDGYSHNYAIPASDGKTPQTLRVHGAFERVYMGSKQYGERPEFADVIAKDILRSMREMIFVSEGVGPAVWITDAESVDTIPEAEKKKHLAEQWRWGTYLVAEADKLFLQGKRNEIGMPGNLYVKMAEFMHLDPRQHPWMQHLEQGDVKACPFCREQIDAMSSVCPKCTKIVDQVLYHQQQRALEVALEEHQKLEKQGFKVERPAN